MKELDKSGLEFVKLDAVKRLNKLDYKVNRNGQVQLQNGQVRPKNSKPPDDDEDEDQYYGDEEQNK